MKPSSRLVIMFASLIAAIIIETLEVVDLHPAYWYMWGLITGLIGGYFLYSPLSKKNKKKRNKEEYMKRYRITEEMLEDYEAMGMIRINKRDGSGGFLIPNFPESENTIRELLKNPEYVRGGKI